MIEDDYLSFIDGNVLHVFHLINLDGSWLYQVGEYDLKTDEKTFNGPHLLDDKFTKDELKSKYPSLFK